jgi:hypothetical protein
VKIKSLSLIIISVIIYGCGNLVYYSKDHSDKKGKLNFVVSDTVSNRPIPYVSIWWGDERDSWAVTDTFGRVDTIELPICQNKMVVSTEISIGPNLDSTLTGLVDSACFNFSASNFIYRRIPIFIESGYHDYDIKMSPWGGETDTVPPEIINWDRDGDNFYILFSERMYKWSVEYASNLVWTIDADCQGNQHWTYSSLATTWIGSNIVEYHFPDDMQRSEKHYVFDDRGRLVDSCWTSWEMDHFMLSTEAIDYSGNHLKNGLNWNRH